MTTLVSVPDPFSVAILSKKATGISRASATQFAQSLPPSHVGSSSQLPHQRVYVGATMAFISHTDHSNTIRESRRSKRQNRTSDQWTNCEISAEDVDGRRGSGLLV